MSINNYLKNVFRLYKLYKYNFNTKKHKFCFEDKYFHLILISKRLSTILRREREVKTDCLCFNVKEPHFFIVT